MEEKSNSLHVIFGTGPVGLATMDALLAKGAPVRMINRSGEADLPDDVELVSGDASDPMFALEASQGASVIYQALNPPYTKWPEMFPPLQKAVLSAAATTGAKLVSLENVYMYGSPGGEPITEDLPYSAQTRKGQTRARMAELLQTAHEFGVARIVTARASDFFGPRVLVSAMGERVFPPILSGDTVQILGNPDMPHTYTYMPDIGRALAILGERDDALGQVWHIPSAETLTTQEFLQLVAERADQELETQVVSKWMLRIISLMNGDLREMMEMLYQFEEPFVVDGSRFAEAFDFEPTPLPEAIDATPDWYRQQAAVDDDTGRTTGNI
jgi:nucleoside-diphosphate-sugar epimerase